MDCPACGYEMAVKEYVEEDAVMIMACRNKQCTAYNRGVEVKDSEEEAQ